MNDEDLRLASDPTTPATELLRLGRLREAALRQRLASNPNTPLPLLLELAARYPDEVLQNGAFALALLERPTLLEGLPPGTRQALAGSHHLGHPEAQVLYASSFQDRSPQIPQILAANPASPPDLLERFLLDPSPLLRHAAADNPATPPGLLRRLRRAGADAALSGVLPGASADPAELEQIAALGLWGEVFAAEHPAAPPELLRRLASRDVFQVRWALAGNPSSPPDLLADLFQHKETHGALAKNPATPPSLLRLLAAHEEPHVRVQVAKNPSTDPSAMLALLGDMTPDVRKWAASSPKITVEWRLRLARLGLPGDLAESILLPPEHIPPEDLAPLLHGPLWFAQIVARSMSLSTHELLRLVRRPGPHRAFQALREPLPACVYELLRQQKEGLWAEMAEPLRKRFPGHREIPAESARTALQAPSLRAPVHIGQWLVEAGEIVDAGLPVVELLCLSNDAVVRVVSPVPARVYPRCTHGQVTPGETLAGLVPVREEEARGSAASERIRGLLARVSPHDEAPAFLPVASRLEAAPVLELRVPPLGESVVEANLHHWNVNPGDWVQPESAVVSAGMDKCDADLTVPAAGIVLERLPEDTTVQIGEVYLRLQLFKVPGT